MLWVFLCSPIRSILKLFLLQIFRFKWQHPVTDHFDGSEDFFSEVFFWITVWRTSKEHFNVFGTKSNLKGSPLTSKATNGYFGQDASNWIKGNVPRFEKIRTDANNRNFMWITCGRRYISASYAQKPQAIGTCGDFCLHPQVFLPADQFTCGLRR